ncbi:hypothetical protein C8A05DRAFT_29735 [Staphylotrichum tortipilum]|uniref:Zn(2)-C6 fungal-type domain-containing protein n=1 Tax=Staphylotrichum tortipilum TaxID=2831512 RepID=A0AAN6MTM9_9PEZI|nr:hypothetical protein C8A05DRAFT_29735 [Staphylotrichum longicolle]
MRRTLRRSCAACARSKHSCDLGTPSCSRCLKRRVQCVYANEPLTATAAPAATDLARLSPTLAAGSHFASVDPFESYPQTRLPRDHVQRLIHSFLHKIAFQYYPLDLSPQTNPFLVSWWPIALGDPALFHVSLQTACLDEELLAQRGFHTSELLMADSVALLRRKVEDSSLAVQDGTMNSVITLATIEFGKGNTAVAAMHVDGVKRLVNLRGGINAVRQTSPLTARMVSWVSMLIAGQPQFETQDDAGVGHGIPPIPEWQRELPATLLTDAPELSSLDVRNDVGNVFLRLRHVFQATQQVPFSSTRLHDLACFVIHRLLLSVPKAEAQPSSPHTESVRYATVLYMFIIQGPTYFPHAVIFNQILNRLVGHLEEAQQIPDIHESLNVWFLSVGMVAAAGTPHYPWFVERAAVTAKSLLLGSWDDALAHIKNILWLGTTHVDDLFRPHWEVALAAASHPESPDLEGCVLPSVTGSGFI